MVRHDGPFSFRKNLNHLFVPISHHWRAVDGLRALAVIWMILLHSLFFMAEFIPQARLEPFLEKIWVIPMAKGHFGVDVFFVISGFLISSLLFREHQLKGQIFILRFYQRRFLRLFPAYAVCLLLCAMTIKVNAAQGWANLFYINNFIPFEKQFMAWTWSLAVEWQFYILFPLFLVCFYRFKKHRLMLLCVMLGLAFVTQGVLVYFSGVQLPIPFHPRFGSSPQFFNHFFDVVYDKPYNRFGSLMCGVIVAYLFHYQKIKVEIFSKSYLRLVGLSISWMMLIIIFMIQETSLSNGPWSFEASWFYLTTHRYLFSMAVSFILFCILSGPSHGVINRFLSSRFWYPIAQTSYSAYLLHPIVILALYFFFLNPLKNITASFLFLLPFVFLVTFFLSVLLYLLVERPGMNFRK